jgi:hypothetical protein
MSNFYIMFMYFFLLDLVRFFSISKTKKICKWKVIEKSFCKSGGKYNMNVKKIATRDSSIPN